MSRPHETDLQIIRKAVLLYAVDAPGVMERLTVTLQAVVDRNVWLVTDGKGQARRAYAHKVDAEHGRDHLAATEPGPFGLHKLELR